MKRILLIYVLLISWLGGSAKNLSAYVDFCKFMVNDSISYVEIYIGIDAYSVDFVPVDEQHMQAEVFASIQLSEEGKTTYFDKFNIQSPIVKSDSSNLLRFNFSKRIVTSNNLYNCELKLKDINSNDTTYTIQFDIDNRFKSDKILFSDIQLLSDFKPSDEKNDFTKSGYEMNPLTSNFYPNHMKSLKYYLEIYNTDKQLGVDEPLVIYSTFRDKNGRLLNTIGKYKRDKSNARIATLNEVDISKLPSGNYFFIVEIRDKENNLMSYTAKEIQRINKDYEESDEPSDELLAQNFTNNIRFSNLQYYMKCLRPLAKEIEQTTIDALIKRGDSTECKNYFFNFWFKRYKNNAQKEWLKYERNIAKVDNEFGCFGRPGYLTEQGRVYLRYGPPNRVETEFTDPGRNAGAMQKEYQIWSYYVLEDQRNKIFVFFKGNPGNCEFDLIHSTARDEIQNQDWLNNNKWRDMLKRQDTEFINPRDHDDYSSEF